MSGPDERVSHGREYSKTKPKSLCRCGHTGDGKQSEHVDGAQPGHGACLECACEKFTWKTFTADFQAYMKGKAS